MALRRAGRSIAAAAVIGYLLAVVLLALILVVRKGALAWVLGVAAVISTLLVSFWPLLATALAGVDQARDVGRHQELLQRFS